MGRNCFHLFFFITISCLSVIYCYDKSGSELVTIYKCCPEKQVLVKENYDTIFCTTSTSLVEVPMFTVYDEDMNEKQIDVTTRFQVKEVKDYNSLIPLQEIYNFYLKENGLLLLEEPNVLFRWKYVLEPKDFCYDYQLNKNKLTQTYFVNVPMEHDVTNYDMKMYISGCLIVSSLGLFVMVMMLLIQNSMKNEAVLALAMYGICKIIASLLIANVELTLIKCHETGDECNSRDTCLVYSYLIYFFQMTSYMWIFVMCFAVIMIGKTAGQERIKLLSIYSVFAFTAGGSMTLLVNAIENKEMRSTPWFVTPGLHSAICYMESPKLFYLDLPGLLLLIASGGFLIRAQFGFQNLDRYCRKRALAGFDSIDRKNDRKIFRLFVRLWTIIFISCILDITSDFFPGKDGFKISNSILGVLIFVCYLLVDKLRSTY